MSVAVESLNARDTAIEALRRLPDTSSWEQLREEIAILAALHEAEEALEAGQVVPNDEVMARLKSWLAK